MFFMSLLHAFLLVHTFKYLVIHLDVVWGHSYGLNRKVDQVIMMSFRKPLDIPIDFLGPSPSIHI